MTMSPSANCLAIIKEFEQGPSGGPALKPYIGKADRSSVATIGWGHVIRAGEDLFRTITRKESDDLLLEDITGATLDVRLFTRELPGVTQDIFDALVSFTFNLGPEALKKVLSRASWPSRIDAMGLYVYSAGQRQAGLVRRRKVEQILATTGEVRLYP